VTGNSATHLQQLHTELEAWQRPATAGRFAAALRRQGASLRSIRLSGASGLTDRHLSSLRGLEALTSLCLAGTGAALSATLLGEVADRCQYLSHLDISSTAADDACLAAAGVLPLSHLAIAGCSTVGAAGVAALAAGPAARSLRWLDLSQTSADDAAVWQLAQHCCKLTGLQLKGCRELSAAGVAGSVCQLRRLSDLGLGRCPAAVTDAAVGSFSHALTQLTRLSLSEARLSSRALLPLLQQLPVLADLDLTACSGEGLSDDQVQSLAKAAAPSTGGSTAGFQGDATAATIQMPQGSNSPTGSPFKRRAAGAV
jgi:hypothetical protein